MSVIEYQTINLARPPQCGLNQSGYDLKRAGDRVKRIHCDSDYPGVVVMTKHDGTSVHVPWSNVNGAKLKEAGATATLPTTPEAVVDEMAAIRAKRDAALAAKAKSEGALQLEADAETDTPGINILAKAKRDPAAKARAAKAAKRAAATKSDDFDVVPQVEDEDDSGSGAGPSDEWTRGE